MITDFIYFNVYFHPGPGQKIDDYVIVNDVIMSGCKRTDEPFFNRFIETNCPKEPVCRN